MPAAQTENPAIAFPAPYQAVLLPNNSLYFGRLSGDETSNPVLTDVYYILNKQDPTTKQVQNVLVQRGKELHRPDRMYLHAHSIIFCGTGRHRPQGRVAHSGSQSAEVASTTTLACPGMRRRAGSSSLLAVRCGHRHDIPCRTLESCHDAPRLSSQPNESHSRCSYPLRGRLCGRRSLPGLCRDLH